MPSDVIIYNATISTQRVDGTPVYTSRRIQLDNARASTEFFYASQPLVYIQCYDDIGSDYQRSDIITIIEIDDQPTIMQDSIYWVRRVVTSGYPLAATEVYCVGGVVTNVTVNTFRAPHKTSTLVGTRAYFTEPLPFRQTAQGAEILATMFCYADYNWKIGDHVDITQIDGMPGVDQVSSYQVHSVWHLPAPVPHVRIDLEAVQS